MLSIPTPIFVAIVFVFGLCIGSFINVLVWRLPKNKSIQGRSECPNCHEQLKWYDLLPVLSYIIQRAKCRYCGKKISARYPIIETVTGAMFAILAVQFLPLDIVSTIIFLKVLFVATLCIATFIIDLEHYLILDALVFPGIALVLVLNSLIDTFSHTQLFSVSSVTGSGVLGVAAAFIPFWVIWYFSKGKWMGFGDVKYVIFMGLTLGLTGVVVGLFFAFMLGAVIGIGMIASGKKHLSSKVPFGTFLTVATVISLLWGQPLWQAYTSLIGL